jgi:glutamate--cysteine ligase
MTTTQFSGTSPRIQGREDLLASFRAGEKPRARWMVGIEHEKLGFLRDTRRPIPYAGPRGIRALLEGFVSRFGWQPVREGENIIALTRDQAGITLEPGGQLELSGAPLRTAHDARQELDVHMTELNALSRELGLVWLFLGRNPVIASADMPWIPKERYAIMRGYLPTRGALALDMMLGTGTVQSNFDYASEADMARKMRVAMAAAPLLAALFANSPFAEGRATGDQSTRCRVWTQTDPSRCGILPAVFAEDFGYEDYVEYALDVPMFFIHRHGHYQNRAGASFRKFMTEGLEGEFPTQEDWTLHLTTLFPEVRLKSYIELRMADVGPPEMIVALAALTRGLFYDDTALKEARLLLGGFRAEQVEALNRAAMRDGLRAEAMGRPVGSWLADLLPMVEAGLARLGARNAAGQDETGYLAPLQEIVASGRSQADRLLESWRGAWGGKFEPLFETLGLPR